MSRGGFRHIPQRTMPFPYANDDSRRVSLEQYAANFHGGILEAHANAFDPYGTGLLSLAMIVTIVLIPD